MPAIVWEDATRAELHVRADLPAPVGRSREAIVARLDALVEAGALASFSVASWAKRVPLRDDPDVGARERELHDEYVAWAGEAGVTLAPSFDTRECYSETTGERQTQLVLPVACLALTDGAGELVAVVPHAVDDRTVTIRDCLAKLAAATGEDRDRDGDQSSVPLTAD